MAKPEISLSIIIPAYNEEKRIGNTIDEIYGFLKKSGIQAKEVIITEDGSKDRTAEIVSSKMKLYKNLKLISDKNNFGRGYALNNAIKSAAGDIALYMDVDLATDLKHIVDAVREIGYGSDIVLGSRYAARNEAYRSFLRILFSKFYNLFVIYILGSKILDHQCGFKAFRRSKILPLLDSVKDLRWFWDTELVIRAQRARFKVVEIPVKWREGQATKVKIFRDSWRMFKSIIKLRFNLLFGS